MNISVHRTGRIFFLNLPTQLLNIACNFNETTLYFHFISSGHHISLALNLCHFVDAFIIHFLCMFILRLLCFSFLMYPRIILILLYFSGILQTKINSKNTFFPSFIINCSLYLLVSTETQLSNTATVPKLF